MDARHFFTHPEYGTRPERATHGLVVPLPAGGLAGGSPVQVWSQTLPVPRRHHEAARQRRRELRRPVPAPGVRAVLLRYADGRADLVLSAHRAALGPADLDRLARELTGAATPGTPPAPGAPPGPWTAPVAPAPAFGLGDGTRAGRYARAELGSVPCPRPEPAQLVAATALVLARYGEPAAFAVVGPDAVTVAVPEVADDDTLDALTRRAEAGLHAGPDADRLPALGILLPATDPAVRSEPAAPPFPVTVAWRWQPDGRLTGHCLFDEAYLAPAVAAAFAPQLLRAAAALAGRPLSTLVSDVELMTPEETARVLGAGRTPAGTGRRKGTVHAAFAALARERPDAPAFTDGATTLTYGELSGRAELLAAAMRDRGAGPGTRVGVCLDRGAELMTVLLGVLMTGAAYVPMDVRAPADRLAFTVRDARPALVVTDVDGFPEVDGVPLTSPDKLRADGPAARPVASAGGPDDPAYIIYTSGSTGRPKGVLVPHRNVLALLDATAGDLGLGPGDVWTLFHSAAFDFSVWEMWGCLLTGGRLVGVPYWVSRSPEEFHELVSRERVTVLSQTPSAFAQLRDADAEAPRGLSVRLVVFGGEPLDASALRAFHDRHPRTRLVNMFGITETTVHVTTRTVTPADMASRSRSVGTALPGWSVSVRDGRGRPLPFGAEGEIWVGGAGVAAGYLNRDELTSARFRPDGHAGGTIYRSGDRGRLRPDGQLEHLGRLDNQVQLRGHRVEPDEVRAVLREQPGVTEAAVVVTGTAEEARLDAYVVLDGGSATAVRRAAARMLPEYMLPSTVTAVPALPLTINGKLDVAALPAPTGGEPPAPAADPPPADGITGALLDIWGSVFGRAVTVDDDFFELGGNSLLAVRLFAAQSRAGLPRVSLRELYLRPTITRLADAMANAPAGTGA
ncbi:hypothetical protein Asp14428_14000 [Actinoplanes sp. NBRC 14428]|nr:hypothetical protein Asp14428_14000 [Actinoplanes sp. NBRC 14428]